MHVAPYDIKITLKGEDDKLVKEFKAYDEPITLQDDDPALKLLVAEAQAGYVGEPEEIIITIRYQWK